MRVTPTMVLTAALAVVVMLPSSADATMWCNMDNAGGSDARQVQQKSARAAAAFLQATSTTFQMLAQLELHLSGDREALATAAKLSAQGTKELERTLTELKAITNDANSLKRVNEELRRATDLSVAFQQALVAPNGPVGVLVADARQRGAEGLLTVCTDSVAQLRAPDTPMGQTFSAVVSGQPPLPPVLWAALAQWNEVLIRGRLVASMFGNIR